MGWSWIRRILAIAGLIGICGALYSLYSRVRRQDEALAKAESKWSSAAASRRVEVRKVLVQETRSPAPPTQGTHDDEPPEEGVEREPVKRELTKEERLAERVARLQGFIGQFESMPISGDERRRELKLGDELAARLKEVSVDMDLGQVSCRGPWCALPLSYETGSDISAFVGVVRDITNELAQEGGGVVLPALATQPEGDRDVGRLFFRWKEEAVAELQSTEP